MNVAPVTVIILTHNEEINISACLESLAGFDDIHVLDSGSTDRTVDLARTLGATIHTNPFRGFGQQRNWAIDHVPARYDWQLHLDADERLTPELATEIASTLAASPAMGGYLVPSKLMFAGRWLRRAGQYPTYQVRLFHRQRLRFVDHGHGQREQTEYPLGTLTQPYLHYAFSQGLDAWFAKHALYARREAEQAFSASLGPEAKTKPTSAPLCTDSTSRRRALKRLASRLPCRYFLRLFYLLVIRRAFLDGRPGIIYSHMLATYEAMMEVHLQLLRHGLKP
jgi:glycosyltransferase involved in cell wall biosynthesis